MAADDFAWLYGSDTPPANLCQWCLVDIYPNAVDNHAAICAYRPGADE